MAASFLKAIFDEAINNPNYFNGRVLTARDLSDEQKAGAQRARRLGQALGEGVAAGLFVEASGDSLVVGAGVAVNRRGDVLVLPSTQTIELSPTAQAAAGGAASPFRPCVALPDVTPLSTGLYVLALTVATELSSERAPHSGLNGADAACVSRYEAQGVQLKLVPVDASLFSVGSLDTAGARLIQSRFAAACFGVAELTAQAATPFAAPEAYGIVDRLRERGDLVACDVPLAALRYAGGLRFVDTWAVRRPCHAPLSAWPLDDDPELPALLLPQHARPRRALEAAAMLMQFQTQLDALRGPEAHTVRAVEHFAFLPSAGYLPGAATREASQARGAFWWSTFFGASGLTLNPLEPAFLRAVFAESLHVDPIPLSPGAAPPVELFQVGGTPADKPLIVFARREPVVASVGATPEPAGEEEPEQRPGRLVVAVQDRAGKVLQRKDVARVGVARPGGKAILAEGQQADAAPRFGSTSVEGRYYKSASSKANKGSYIDAYKALAAERARKGKAGKKIVYDEVQDMLDLGVTAGKMDLAIYSFTLEPGDYVVSATPADTRVLTSASKRVTIVSGGTTTAELRLTRGAYVDPDIGKFKQPRYKVFGFDDRYTLKNGDLIEQIYVDPKWRDPGYVDPPPDWRVDVGPEILEALEQSVGGWLGEEPGVASAGVNFYVNPEYSLGGAPSEEPYAFIGTADGSFFPVVLVGGQHSLNGDVPATKSGLADLGADEFDATLRGGALENLDALAGAWGDLLARNLSIDSRGAATMVVDAREAASGLQGSFARYPGVSGAMSAALAEKYHTDADLANATPAEVQSLLSQGGQAASLSFATRLVERARANVPPAAWSLDTLAADAATREGLAGLGVESKGDFNRRYQADQGAELRGALGLSESSFGNLVDAVQADLIAGAVRMAPDAGVASVAGVSRDQAELLVSSGLASTGAELARASREEVAAILDISVEEAGQIVGNAAAKTGELAVLKDVVGLESSDVAKLQEQGVVSLVDLAGADRGTIVGSVGERAGRGVDVASGAITRNIRFHR